MIATADRVSPEKLAAGFRVSQKKNWQIMLLMMDLSAAADSSILRGTWLFPVDDRQNTIREIAKHASEFHKKEYLRNLRVEHGDIPFPFKFSSVNSD